MRLERLPWQRALVIGLGASGLSAARLLARAGVHVRGYDRRTDVVLPEGVEPILGEESPPDRAFAGVDLMVLSPGVPPADVVARLRRIAPAAAVEGELGLSFRCLVATGIGVPTVLVTGTNGKSTVTALTGELLAAGGLAPFVGGNLGTPLADLVVDVADAVRPPPRSLVLECSSFQLETWPELPNRVGMVLNVTPDHLDRYATMADYADTKARALMNIEPGGLALVDDRDAWTDRIVPRRSDIDVVRVGSTRACVEGPGAGRTLVVGEERIDRSLLRLRGRHNAQNAVFALAAARHLGVAREACTEVLARFEGLPHRMRLVRELDGVRFYDDSKATNVASAVASLGGLDEAFVLIAGGRGKGDDTTGLRELLRARGRGLVAIGETTELFIALADGIVPAERAGSLEAAVHAARAMARPGDAVVLAPACASYDMFRNYAHRGDVFAAAVMALQ